MSRDWIVIIAATMEHAGEKLIIHIADVLGPFSFAEAETQAEKINNTSCSYERRVFVHKMTPAP